MAVESRKRRRPTVSQDQSRHRFHGNGREARSRRAARHDRAFDDRRDSSTTSRRWGLW